MFTENLDFFVADFGVSVSFAGAPDGLLGLKDVADQDVLDEGGRAVVIAGDTTCLVRTDAVAALAIGGAVTVDGHAYVVRGKHRVADGAFTVLGLRG